MPSPSTGTSDLRPGASRTVRAVSLLIVLAVLSSCASLGGGDPVVVRTEDTLQNSLSLYVAVMEYHRIHSKTETPALYAALEQARVDFPIAWKAVFDAETAYKKGIGTKGDLQRTLDVLAAVVASLQAAGVLK